MSPGRIFGRATKLKVHTFYFWTAAMLELSPSVTKTLFSFDCGRGKRYLFGVIIYPKKKTHQHYLIFTALLSLMEPKHHSIQASSSSSGVERSREYFALKSVKEKSKLI